MNEHSPDKNKDGAKKERRGTFQRRWRATSLPNKLMIVATIVIALATVVNVVVSVKQWSAMRGQLAEMGRQGDLMRQQLVGSQATVLKFTKDFNLEGFGVEFTNVRDVAATGTHIIVRMTPVSLPEGLPFGSSVINEATAPRIVKDKPFGRGWPYPWPQQEFRGNDWPGKRTVRVEGEYSYDDGFGNKVSESFCTVRLPRRNIVTKAENAFVGGPSECEGIESTIRAVWERMKEAEREKKSSN
jgi:hypothetical protein